MTWTETQNIITEGLNFLRLASVSTNASGYLSGLGTPIDLTMITKESSEYANATAEAEYKEKNLTNLTKLKLQVTTTTVNPATGATTGAGSASSDKFEVSMLLNKTQMDNLISDLRLDKIWYACKGIGRTTTGVIAGYEHLVGKISGNLKQEQTGEMSEVSVVLQGGKAYDTVAGFYTDVSTKINTLITPVGEDTGITPSVPANDTTLKTGVIQRTA